MRPGLRRAMATWAAGVLLLGLWAARPVLAAGPGGLLLDPAGDPAVGYRVLLLDRAGRALAATTSDAAGRYRLDGVGPGSYTLGILTPEGTPVPVLGGLQVAADSGELPPVRLVRYDASTLPGSLGHAQGVGAWWKGMPPSGRVWVIVGVVTGVGIAVATFGGGGNDSPASPF